MSSGEGTCVSLLPCQPATYIHPPTLHLLFLEFNILGTSHLYGHVVNLDFPLLELHISVDMQLRLEPLCDKVTRIFHIKQPGSD